MGESIGILSILTIVGAITFAILARMISQVMKDNGREKKVTEAIASMNTLMTHIAVYNANTVKSAKEREVINRMIDALNQRYSNWRGFEKIPTIEAKEEWNASSALAA